MSCGMIFIEGVLNYIKITKFASAAAKLLEMNGGEYENEGGNWVSIRTLRG